MEYLVAISFLIICMITIYSLVKLNTKLWIMLIVIPYLIFSTGFAFNVYNSFKGFATTKTIPDHSRFLFGVVAKPNVFILVNGPDGIRLHMMPYSEYLRKEVEQGNKMVEQGQRMTVQNDGESKSPRLHQFEHKKLMPKNSNNN